MRKLHATRPATTYYKAQQPLDYAAKDRKEIINSAGPSLWDRFVSWLNSPVRF